VSEDLPIYVLESEDIDWLEACSTTNFVGSAVADIAQAAELARCAEALRRVHCAATRVRDHIQSMETALSAHVTQGLELVERVDTALTAYTAGRVAHTEADLQRTHLPAQTAEQPPPSQPNPAVLVGLSVLTIISLKHCSDEDVRVTYSGPAANGKYCGWITSQEGRPVTNTEATFDTPSMALAHMYRVIAAARTWEPTPTATTPTPPDQRVMPGEET